jgi:acyl-CoA reductase-like NAD-dependent aldehyde dehydrogenase
LLKLANYIEEHTEFCSSWTEDNGMPISLSFDGYSRAVQNLSLQQLFYMIKMITSYLILFWITHYVSLGSCRLYFALNLPLCLFTWKLFPLASGNCVVAKPELTPIQLFLLVARQARFSRWSFEYYTRLGHNA